MYPAINGIRVKQLNEPFETFTHSHRTHHYDVCDIWHSMPQVEPIFTNVFQMRNLKRASARANFVLATAAKK